LGVARDSVLQIAEKKLEKKRKLAAERKETYKIEKEATARPTIIRSGFAFDAPTRLNSRGQEYSGDAGVRACGMQCVTSIAVSGGLL
jgi:hypothetical protein